MSGWYLTTDDYDGNIESMSVSPLQQLVPKRRDLLQFLALPPGYFFEIYDDQNCGIGFQPEEES